LRSIDVRDDPGYVDMLTTLSEASSRRSFDPYADVDWQSPEHTVSRNDPRWILPRTDPLGRHPWYLAQSQQRRIEIGMWRQSNVAKVGLHFESILIRGLMNYTFRLPNGSPEYRYLLHEAVEECNHSMMFQEMVNRIGADVTGLPRYLRCVSALLPLVAGPMPNVFFFGVLAGEEPFDHAQKNIMRADEVRHPLIQQVMSIHLAEEARHISFAHEYLLKHVPVLSWWKRFLLSLYVPMIMRVLGGALVKPPRVFWRQFGIPRRVRKELFFRSPDSRTWWRDLFADVRMLSYDAGLMNPGARLVWWMCRINGAASRYRNEPQRHPTIAIPAA
jgi:P-aminobenzoate N-oxygenase AurF